MTRTIWIDVEDLFDYARGNPRPSGIQRLSFQMYDALRRRGGRDVAVRFVRHAPDGERFRSVEWHDIAALFDGLTRGARLGPAVPPAVADPARRGAGRRLARSGLDRLSPSLRVGVTDVALTGLRFVHAQKRLLSVAASAVRRRVDRPAAAVARVTEWPDPFAEAAAPGDVLLVLGSPWSYRGYGAMVERHRDRWGLRFAMLVYDLIPLRRPEFCDAPLVEAFRDFFDEVFPLCDQVFAISRATADDVEAYSREIDLKLPGNVVPIPIGTALRGTSLGAGVPAERPAHLPTAGGYALVVSTIEARKNHLLLFRVWRRLLETMPRDRVPTLVFAGRIGWLVEDLMRQIANTGDLGGKLVIVQSPTDPEVAALYAGCLFTVFPSFSEGWGLPVSESLAFGKPCLVANTPALLEAGGGLVRSFDPDNLHDAVAVVRDAIEDRAGLAAWEARVRREFRPVAWSDTVEALLDGLAITDRAVALVAE